MILINTRPLLSERWSFHFRLCLLSKSDTHIVQNAPSYPKFPAEVSRATDAVFSAK
jgi:hypothetical protein